MVLGMFKSKSLGCGAYSQVLPAPRMHRVPFVGGWSQYLVFVVYPGICSLSLLSPLPGRTVASKGLERVDLRVSRLFAGPLHKRRGTLHLIDLNLASQTKGMKKIRWIRKNWLLVAGLSFLSIHVGTYLIQRVAKSSAKSSLEIKSKDFDK
ncbi:uncharacterized LOC128706666 homolog [Rhineura floridana]|uniref:uncharacterized LOC128706666 homolog n=1 Tax=Rhineura floridana TaxID=261503 RepID=UPI002AC8885B|nr:uncharacterized LOC128706666 homolog [Rhineura floridana]